MTTPIDEPLPAELAAPVARAEEWAAISGPLSPEELWQASGVTQNQRTALLANLLPRFVVTKCEKRVQWSPLPQHRVSILARLLRENRLAECLATARPPDDGFGRGLRGVLTQGADYSLERASGEELAALAAALQAILALDVEKPDLRELSALLDAKRFRNELSLLLKHFVGRGAELAELEWFLQNDDPDWQSSIVTGIGGAGKSTLLAALARRVFDKTPAPATIAVLDFDRPGLDARDHYWLESEIARQVAHQHPRAAELLHGAISEAREQRRETERATSSSSAEYAQRERSRTLTSHVRTALLRARGEPRPLLLILDTFENVIQGKHDSQVLQWLDNTAHRLRPVPLRVVFCGRLFGYSRELKSRMRRAPIELGELEPAVAAELLVRHGLNPDSARRLASSRVLPRRPLELKLLASLAADSSAAEIAELEVELRRGGERARGLFAGVVYRRVLARIGDSDDLVRKLACPGLVLRFMTVELVRAVLAPCLDLGQLAEHEARAAFERLTQVEWLVERRGQAGVVWHRSDLRGSMLKAMIAEEHEAALRIHLRAAEYFEREAIPALPQEALYHRLMLTSDAASTASITREEVASGASEIFKSIDDLPSSAAALLRYGAGESLGAEELLLLCPSHREAAYGLSGGERLATRNFGEALALYERLRRAGELEASVPVHAWEWELLISTASWDGLAPQSIAPRAPTPTLPQFAQTVLRMAFGEIAVSDSQWRLLDAHLTWLEEGLGEDEVFVPARPMTPSSLQAVARLAFGLVMLGGSRPLSSSGRAAAENVQRLADELISSSGGFGAERAALLGVLARVPGSFRELLLRTPVVFAPASLEWLGRLEAPRLSSTVTEIQEELSSCTTVSAALDCLSRRSEVVTLRSLLAEHSIEEDQFLQRIGQREQIALVQGPTPELRDPARFALLEAFVERPNELQRLLQSQLRPIHLEELDPAKSTPRVAELERMLDGCIELIDRVGRLGALLDACLAVVPEAKKLRLVRDAWTRWRAALLEACEASLDGEESRSHGFRA